MAKFVDIVTGVIPGDHDEDDGANTLAQKIHAITNVATTIISVSIAITGKGYGIAVIVWANA